MSTHCTSTTEVQRVATGEAHGKAILLGEHAAVYGAPALALPLPALTCRATVRRTTGPGAGVSRLRLFAPGPHGTPEEAAGDVPEELLLLLRAFAERAGLATPPHWRYASTAASRRPAAWDPAPRTPAHWSARSTPSSEPAWTNRRPSTSCRCPSGPRTAWPAASTR